MGPGPRGAPRVRRRPRPASGRGRVRAGYLPHPSHWPGSTLPLRLQARRCRQGAPLLGLRSARQCWRGQWRWAPDVEVRSRKTASDAATLTQLVVTVWRSDLAVPGSGPRVDRAVQPADFSGPWVQTAWGPDLTCEPGKVRRAAAVRAADLACVSGKVRISAGGRGVTASDLTCAAGKVRRQAPDLAGLTASTGPDLTCAVGKIGLVGARSRG